ncbi:MAG: hypothetical protein EBY39_14250, partial [Flavobacteriia bacterium]|nr:hypothetical protein [Flavobacteriia bacterium]
RLIDVKNLIDIPAPEKKSEFITLSQANADRVVELITTILEKRQEQGSVGTGKAAAGQATTGQTAQPPIPGFKIAVSKPDLVFFLPFGGSTVFLAGEVNPSVI